MTKAHSSRCMRLLSVRVIVAFGLVSLALTFVTLKFATEPQASLQQQHLTALQNGQLPDREAVMEQEGKVSSNKGCKMQVRDTRPLLSVPRIAKYCNIPSSESPGEEGLVPKEFHLVAVHAAIRHGDRAPLIRLPGENVMPLNCMVDTSQVEHLPKLKNFVQVMEQAAKIQTDYSQFSRWALYPSRPVCGEGQLTGQGAIQHILNGLHLHQQYAQPPHNLALDHDTVSVHSTIVSRTYQSAIAFLYGMLPDFDPSKIKMKSSQSIMFCDATQAPGSVCSCPGLDAYRSRAFAACRLDPQVSQAAATYGANTAQTVAKVLGIPSTKLPAPEGVMDALSRYACHSMPAPCITTTVDDANSDNNKNGTGSCPETTCITASTVEGVWAPVDEQSRCIHANADYKKFAIASTQGLLLRIAQSLHKHILLASRGNNTNSESFNGANPIFALYSGHDNTLTPLIAALGLDEFMWPGYASRLVFELYYRQTPVGDAGETTQRQHFIRILLNGKPVTSQAVFCRAQSVISGVKDMCEFDRFYGHVTQLNVASLCASIRGVSGGLGNLRRMRVPEKRDAV